MREPKIVTNPSLAVITRALALDWSITDSKEEERKLLFNPGRSAGVILKIPFTPIIYLGTATIKGHKLKENLDYAITPQGPVFSGMKIKQALKILGKRRVRVFFHTPKKNKNGWEVLLLGTKNGTIAIAPILVEDEDIKCRLDEETVLLTPYWTLTAKAIRGLLYGRL